MRRIQIASLLAAGSLALLSSCDIEAKAKERSYGLADEYRTDKTTTLDLEEKKYDAVKGQVLGSLEMLCGTPAQPSYLLLPDWVDDGYNPNRPDLPKDEGGSGEFSEDEFAVMEADNARVFRKQLGAIKAGNYAGVTPFRGAPRLQETWDILLEDWEYFDAEYKLAMAEWESKVADWELAKEAWDAHEALSEEELAELGETYEAPEEPGEEPGEEPWHEFADEEGEMTPAEVFQDEAEYTLLSWYPSFEDSAELYRLECLHCHGTEGKGDGSTAPFLFPRPRNYQPGKFKWTVLSEKTPPRRADLHKVISEGSYTTAMPAFRRFSSAQIHGLVDMVRLLSIRGMTEDIIARSIHSNEDEPEPLTSELIMETYEDVWAKWDTAADSVIVFEGHVPSPTDESIARGKELYMDANGGACFECHGLLGQGDGIKAWEAHPEGLDEDGDGRVDQVRMIDEWGEDLIPRNLTSGIFRGGRRPIDIYRRISGGINGTPMPAVPDNMNDDDRWAIVHYVLSLSEVHDGRGLDSMRMRAGEEDHGDGHDEPGDESHSEGHDSDDGH